MAENINEDCIFRKNEVCHIMDHKSNKEVYIVDANDAFLYKEKGVCIF